MWPGKPQVILSPGQMAESVGSSQFGHLLLQFFTWQIGEMNYTPEN